MKQKRVLAVHDSSCVGRCSLTVALPILSAAGLEGKRAAHGCAEHAYRRIYRVGRSAI